MPEVNPKQDELGVLFLHALPLDGTMWADFMDLIPGGCFAPALYEYGDSIENWASMALEATPAKRLVVVGCSVGGSCALEVAALAPDRVAALVLIGCKAGHNPDPELRHSAVSVINKQGIEKAWDKYWAPLFAKTADTAVIAKAKSTTLSRSREHIIRGIDVFHSRTDRAGFAAQWAGRTVIVSGEEDIAPSLSYSRKLATDMSNASIHIVQGSGHYVPLEKPEPLKEILLDVIAECRAE
jgi:pimeloyl-ACP methyl ester carboxylesterase